MSWMIFGLVAFLLGGVAVVKYTDWQRTKKIETAFAHRRSLSTVEFYEAFFQKQGVPEKIASGVKCILEEQLSADLSRIIDSDDFSKNLNFFWDYDSMADMLKSFTRWKSGSAYKSLTNRPLVLTRLKTLSIWWGAKSMHAPNTVLYPSIRFAQEN